MIAAAMGYLIEWVAVRPTKTVAMLACCISGLHFIERAHAAENWFSFALWICVGFVWFVWAWCVATRLREEPP